MAQVVDCLPIKREDHYDAYQDSSGCALSLKGYLVSNTVHLHTQFPFHVTSHIPSFHNWDMNISQRQWVLLPTTGLVIRFSLVTTPYRLPCNCHFSLSILSFLVEIPLTYVACNGIGAESCKTIHFPEELIKNVKIAHKYSMHRW
jgi:hypothetical protein